MKLSTRMSILLGLILVASGTSTLPAQPEIPKRRPLAFVHVNVIPMTQGGLLIDQTVIVEAGKITHIGPSASIRIPSNRELVQAGLDHQQALLIGTKNGGQFIKRHVRGAESFGSVAVGERADLLLLHANPLMDVNNISQIAGVTVRGRWLPREEIQKMRSEAVKSFAR